jgi:dipeptidyl aminopeptidase/acylaminoacyl peptidase
MPETRMKFSLIAAITVAALALLAAFWANGSGLSETQQGAMHNCPPQGKWAIAVWNGDDHTDAEHAFATCSEGPVAVAYSIDPETQAWSRWFASRPGISNLTVVSNMQGVIALGGAGPTAPVSAGTSAQEDAMQNCPQPGKWAISVWSGDDDTDIEQAFATCGEGSVAVAYSIDPQTQVWSRWFADRPELSNLETLDDMQGVIALGAITPTPTQSERIAFGSNRDGNFEIYAMNADGSGQTRLTDNPASDHAPAWSPDGSKIAFRSYRDENAEIYVMNADGSGQIRLTDNPAIDDAPAWSPDGSKIAFESYRDDNWEIYMINADEAEQTRLTNNPAWDSDPAWSPDGSKIAFHSNRDGNFEIYVMNADGSDPTNLTNNPAGDYRPAWSPDGSKIAFASERNGNFEIYVMNADGTSPTNLTNNPDKDDAPAWSPDGSKIAFDSFRDGDFEIYVMNADGSGQTRLTNNPAADYSAAW